MMHDAVRVSKIISYRDLRAWQKAMDLADVVYELTEAFPERERYGLAAEMRKSAVSVPSNIAEGHRRRRSGYLYHLSVALGSHGELETQTELAHRRRYVSDTAMEKFTTLARQVGELMHALVRSLEQSC